jgi:ubiquinone/menaquinone biosynthesis C-methylase UbiE
VTLYQHRVLPHLINFAMKHREIAQLRAAHVSDAQGVVVEVGIGSGLNLPYYSHKVTRVHGFDPSVELLAMAREKAAAAQFPVDLRNQDASRIPMGEGSADTLVMTWTLCSIVDPSAALREMRRVLKPGGTFIFVEHGLSPDGEVRKWQNRLTPLWRRLGGGCHLNRKIDDLVRDAGFDILSLRTEYLPGPRALTFMYEGRATR